MAHVLDPAVAENLLVYFP